MLRKLRTLTLINRNQIIITKHPSEFCNILFNIQFAMRSWLFVVIFYKVKCVYKRAPFDVIGKKIIFPSWLNLIRKMRPLWRHTIQSVAFVVRHTHIITKFLAVRSHRLHGSVKLMLSANWLYCSVVNVNHWHDEIIKCLVLFFPSVCPFNFIYLERICACPKSYIKSKTKQNEPTS